MEQFKSLLQPRSLDEHHAVYLFCDFCEYTLAVNGEKVNIKMPGVARLMYVHLVQWFKVCGKPYYPMMKSYEDAQYVLFSNTGISEWEDLRKIFTSKNAKIYAKTGYPIPFTVIDEKEPGSVIVPEIVAKSDEDMEKHKSNILPVKKKRGRPRKNPVPDESQKAMKIRILRRRKVVESDGTAESTELAEDKKPDNMDNPVEQPRQKRKYNRKKTAAVEPETTAMPETEPVEQNVQPSDDAQEQPKKKRTKIHNQHIGIVVPQPILYRENINSDDYFIFHGKPGNGDRVYAYPVEPEKTIDDYSFRAIGASWKDPYLLALRHDYAKRTNTKTTDVRKVTITNWRNREHKKYIDQLRQNEMKKQFHK